MKLLPARKIYYGWYILVGVILAQFMATSTGQMVSGVFLDPLVEALQIEVWQFAAAISLATALGGNIHGLYRAVGGPHWPAAAYAGGSHVQRHWSGGVVHSVGLHILLPVSGHQPGPGTEPLRRAGSERHRVPSGSL